MDPLIALLVAAALVAATTVAGLILRNRSGRMARPADALADGELETEAPAGRITLLQLSTPMCARCPGTARLLGAIAAARDGVVHVDIDVAARPELADRFGVLQTPTTLVVDPGRRIRARIGGVPDRAGLEGELDLILEGAR